MTLFFSDYFRVGRESVTIFQHLFICLAAGFFVYTKGVTVFDLVSSSSFGDYYKVETFPLTAPAPGLHRLRFRLQPELFKFGTALAPDPHPENYHGSGSGSEQNAIAAPAPAPAPAPQSLLTIHFVMTWLMMGLQPHTNFVVNRPCRSWDMAKQVCTCARAKSPIIHIEKGSSNGSLATYHFWSQSTKPLLKYEKGIRTCARARSPTIQIG